MCTKSGEFTKLRLMIFQTRKTVYAYAWIELLLQNLQWYGSCWCGSLSVENIPNLLLQHAQWYVFSPVWVLKAGLLMKLLLQHLLQYGFFPKCVIYSSKHIKSAVAAYTTVWFLWIFQVWLWLFQCSKFTDSVLQMLQFYFFVAFLQMYCVEQTDKI